MTKRFLIDGYNLIYRLFYAVPPFSLPDGTPIHVVFWLAKSLLGFFERHPDSFLYFIMDSKSENHRSKIYSEYKANRDRMPDDLRAQESYVFSLLQAFWIPVIAYDGFEADDIIATLCKKFDSHDGVTYIVSGDKDLYQLINDSTFVYDTMRNKIAKRADAIEKFGVSPEFVVDWLAICWDASDNIPGIPWFWPKKATDLITRFGSLESIYDNLADLPEKMSGSLREHREVAFLSKRLADLHYEVPVTSEDLSGYDLSKSPYSEQVIDFFSRMGFRSLIPKDLHASLDAVSSEQKLVSPLDTVEILENVTALDRLTPLMSSVSDIGFSLRANFDWPASSRCLYLSVADTLFVFDESADQGAFARCLDVLDWFGGNIHGFDTKESLRARFLGDINGPSVSGQANSQLSLL